MIRSPCPGLGIGRVGAWPTAAVQQMTRVALLRIRFKLTVHARKERLLLAEEAALVAIQGGRIVATGEAARELLNAPATADLAPSPATGSSRRRRRICPACLQDRSPNSSGRARNELMQDHARLRAAAGSASRVTVEAVLPPDVIGLFVLDAGRGLSHGAQARHRHVGLALAHARGQPHRAGHGRQHRPQTGLRADRRGLRHPQGADDPRGDLDRLPRRPVPFRCLREAARTRRSKQPGASSATSSRKPSASTISLQQMARCPSSPAGASRSWSCRLPTKSSTGAARPSRPTGRAPRLRASGLPERA